MDPSAYPLHAETEERHWWFVARRRILAGVIRALDLPSPPRLLEFGSGTGGNLSLLAGFGPTTAVELDDDARSLSSRLHPSVRHVRALDEISAEQPFDIAFALDVIEHLDDPGAVLRELGTHLAPGAPLIVMVPANPWMYGKHDRYLHHRRRYNRSLLRAHLSDGGFAVERVSSMNAALFPLAIGARIAEAVGDLVRSEPKEPRGMTVPPSPINRVLTAIFGGEHVLLSRGSLPLGLSLLAVARR